jgi:hypothetical protein
VSSISVTPFAVGALWATDDAQCLEMMAADPDTGAIHYTTIKHGPNERTDARYEGRRLVLCDASITEKARIDVTCLMHAPFQGTTRQRPNRDST